MKKVYITDKQGNEVLPKTHVSAVYDDEGNDLGSHLGAFEDEVRGLVDTPHQEYVTVATYDSLPASGSEDTIYRVSNYDGSQSQVAADVYSEYAWDGTQYVFLCVKSAVGEVFDISAYHNNATYADLNAALTSNTGGVPQSLQKGGMSIKYVQSSDNKYVQCRYMSSSTATNDFTNVKNWQGFDDKPLVGSQNLAGSSSVAFLYDYTGLEYINVYSFVQYKGNFTDKWVVDFGQGKHILIPVTSGEKYYIKSVDAIHYGLLTSSHSEPVSQGDTVDYVNGETNRKETQAGSYVIVDIPSDAASLCIETVYYGGYKPTMCILKLKNGFLDSKLKQLETGINNLDIIVNSGVHEELTIPNFEKGTISANGTKVSSTVVIRTANEIPVPVLPGSIVKVKANLEEAQEIYQNIAYISLNIHCWDSSHQSLGRTETGYAYVTGGEFVDYPLVENTAYIDISLSCLDETETNISNNEFLSGFNNSKSDIFEIKFIRKSVDEEIDDLSNEIDDLSEEIRHTDYTYNYYGECIRLNKNKCKYSPYMDISYEGLSGQGCISYNDYLLVGGHGGYVKVFNLINKQLIDTVTLASAGSNNHLNCISIGVEGNPQNTVFDKYIYVSETNTSDITQNRCFVEDFSINGSLLVQTISYNGTHFGGNYQWIVDTDRKFIFAIGNTKSAYNTPGNKIAIVKFNLPLISDGTTVILTDNDVISYHVYEETTDTPDNAFMYIFQGGEYYNGMLILPFGGYLSVARPIYFIDCDTYEIKSIIQTQGIFNHEIEGVTVYENKLLICYPNNSKVYALEFV